MMTTTKTERASSAAPPNALRMWTDGTRIYVELPGSPGLDPYIVDYRYNVEGLIKALNLLCRHRVDYDYLGTRPIPDTYRKRWSENYKPEPGTPEQRAQAEAMLRRMGILK